MTKENRHLPGASGGRRLPVIRLAEREDAVIILDQTRLPGHEEYVTITTLQQAFDAILRLQVRGAPAIGVFAAYAMAALARAYGHLPAHVFAQRFQEQAAFLNSARPTAVNLSWALNRMTTLVNGLAREASGEAGNAASSGENEAASGAETATGEVLLPRITAEAKAIDAENEAMTREIARHGITLLRDGDGILTHCNAGYLACLGYGTATAPIYFGTEQGQTYHVYADETRPLLQGARLTAYELEKAGIDVTLICDNMASTVMKQGKVQAVFVGCDRIAANGDFANKIGTSGVAILAKHYGIPFYTLGPSSTIDFATATGADIHIEERDPAEIKEMWYAEAMALRSVKSYNPSFDVTDHSLVTGIVTERGIAYPPFTESLRTLFPET